MPDERGRRQRIPATPPGIDEPAVVGNAADKRQVRKAKKTERDAREEELDDVRAVASTPEGQRFLWRLMGFCRTFESTFNADPYLHAFAAGFRDVGNSILTDLMEADGEAFLRMIEANRREHE